MVSKYFLWTSVLIMNLLLLSSCLGSSEGRDMEYSANAQIHSISISSSADTLNLLNSTVFTIDQVNGRLFNEEPLPYLFNVDSVILNISGASTLIPFSDVTLRLTPDTLYSWTQSDSVPINRLYGITAKAQDGVTEKNYSFQLNIYQQDPYILHWERLITENFITPQAQGQKTIDFNDRFITYYLLNGNLGIKSSDAGSGNVWTDGNLQGIPSSVRLETLTVSDNSLYILDETNIVFSSSDGFNWAEVVTEYPVTAVYGNLPSATKGRILVMIDDNGTLKFAETNDFTDMQIMATKGRINPVDFPVKDFSSISIESPTSYSVKYILLSGGLSIDKNINNNIIILQEKDGVITGLISETPELVSLKGSRLFFYDDKTYVIVSESNKNYLMYSENYGLNWIEADENQAFPVNFTNRVNTSVITDDNNFIWIFGGVSTGQTQLADVWKGRLNKFAMN